MSEPNQPVDPTKQKRIRVGFYAVAPSPVDGTIWGSVTGYPGSVVRVDPGANPPVTALSEIYNAPLPGFSPRGADIDSKGVMWSALASGHLGSFDRSKCKGPLNGPTATGNQCPEGWTLYTLPGPQFGNVTDEGSGETPYYAWVDQHNTFGLGNDVPFATGNRNDSLIALVDGKPVNLACPIRWAFGRRGWTGASTTPMPVGRAAACGRTPAPHALPPRRRQGHLPKIVHSRCGPIRSPISGPPPERPYRRRLLSCSTGRGAAVFSDRSGNFAIARFTPLSSPSPNRTGDDKVAPQASRL